MKPAKKNHGFVNPLHNAKKSALVAVLSFSTFFMAGNSQASLQDELDSFFGDMSNTTNPGVFETQRRGVISGGRHTTKAKIAEENLVHFTPPSFKGGCGGIDMFGGSFSFISAEQLVQMLRQVAANAKGYAFQIALDTVCTSCATWIESFQKKVQQLNQMNANSCQLAQGLINDATQAFDFQGKTTASLASVTQGIVGDFFSSKEQVETGKSAEESLPPEELIRLELVGNIVWQQLQKQNAKTWFTYGDQSLLETIMSLTGTIIREHPIPDPNMPGSPSDADTTMPLITKAAKPDLLRAILDGGDVRVYKCDTADHCLNPGESTIVLKGLATQIEEMLLGTGSAPGVISKFARNQGILTAQEQAFISNLPVGTGAIVRNLAILSEDAARMFALKASNAIALSMVYVTTEELFRAAGLAVSQSRAPNQAQAIALISQSQQKVREDYKELRSMHGEISALLDHYNTLLSNLRKQRYSLSTLTTPQGNKE